MFEVIDDQASIGGQGSSDSHELSDARFHGVPASGGKGGDGGDGVTSSHFTLPFCIDRLIQLGLEIQIETKSM